VDQYVKDIQSRKRKYRESLNLGRVLWRGN
jgi:hypothetical protein